MYYEHKVNQVVNDFIEKNQLTNEDFIFRKRIKYGKDADKGRSSVMNFNSLTNTIVYDIDRLNHNKKRMPHISPDLYLILVFIHELGHYFHNKEEHKSISQLRTENKGNKSIKWKHPLELAAWEYGSRFVPKEHKEDYDFINQANMLLYEDTGSSKQFLEEKQVNYYLNLPIQKSVPITKSALSKVISWPNSFARSCSKTELIQNIEEILNSEESVKLEDYYNAQNYLLVKSDLGNRLIVRDSYDYYNVVSSIELSTGVQNAAESPLECLAVGR